MRRRARVAPLLGALLALLAPAAFADGEDAETEAPEKVPAPDPDKASQTGTASWYGPGFHGRQTANGEIYDQDAMTAAHKWLPFGTQIVVTNLDNGCSVVLRVTDRGPYHGERILDCSKAAAEALGFIDKGVARIRWDVLRWGTRKTRALRLGLGPPLPAPETPLLQPPRLREPQTPIALEGN